MANYKYKAKDEKGRTISGNLRASSEGELHSKLREQGLLLTDSEVVSENKRSVRIKANSLADFARSLGQLLNSGVTLVRALGIMCDDEAIKPQQKKLYETVLKDVRGGMTLSDALQNQGQTFPPLFVNMIRSSESGGNLDQVCLQMADYYQKEYELNQKIKSSTTYPKILGVLMIAAAVIIMGFVVPQFGDLFDQMDKLPPATEILLGLSNFIAKRWYIIIFAIFVLYVAFRVLRSVPAVRYAVDMVKIKAPVFGKLNKVICTARFARTLASLYSAGIPIVTCLSIAATTIGNDYIEAQFDDLIASVRAGDKLSDALARVDGFVKKLPSSVMVGEETGALDKMLISIADQMDYDSNIAINKMVSYLEPAMIVIMAIAIGFMMIAIITPIYGSYQAISNQ